MGELKTPQETHQLTPLYLRILRGGTFDGRKSSDLRSPLNGIGVGEVERVGIECDNHALSHSKTERQGNGFYGIHSRLDRKSTRLNSSHANISYAVFCLKKKH